MENTSMKKVAFVVIAILAVIILFGFYSKTSGPKYDITLELYNGSIPSLRMTITGPAAADDIVATLISPKKRFTTICIKPADMIAGFKSVSFDFTDIGVTNGRYVLKVQSNGKTIVKNLDVIFNDGRVFAKNTNLASL